MDINTIKAAQANDLAGITEVLAAIEGRVTGLANQAVRKNLRGDFDDYRQDALCAFFAWLPSFGGDSVEDFMFGAYGAMLAATQTSVDSDRNDGIMRKDPVAFTAFKAAMERTGNDTAAAERLAIETGYKGAKISAERIRAVRLAWAGSLSLDAKVTNGQSSYSPSGAGNNGMDFADTITYEDGSQPRDNAVSRRVRDVLDTLPTAQADVLHKRYGIAGQVCIGDDVQDLAASVGKPEGATRTLFARANDSFTNAWIAAVASTEEAALSWAQAAADEKRSAKASAENYMKAWRKAA